MEATKTGPLALKLCNCKEATMRGFIIGVLLVAVGVLGYLYWDSEHNTVLKAPGVEIKKN
jgi:predicted negative regulator of RcsB-dependent stress response